MNVVLDTSVLIAPDRPLGVTAAISVVSISELHFGVLAAADDEERARRVARLGEVEATFDPLPITVAVAREWGRLSAAVRNRGGQPRRRAADLAIAATANTYGVPLLTHNTGDFAIIDDLVDVRSPVS
ncbi:PIN domain-containing protein [Mycobacterium sp. M1]|uniref:Ribonuclease VapC n=1 Tax=Mycolicibacter acidiphilus TaxID=2835306 RepID=A0ABS5RLY9_9MYCO|nr:PIN domain-containing protein [Mycolicibacter acidiphilus]